MRLRRLDLLRYGHLSDVSLRFDAEPTLHVVLGLNEAGKTTALAAIADALFGFGHRTDFDFLHGSAQLRVGFALSSSAGAEAAFVRRKGRGNTLRGADEQPVPEEALLPYLGGATRERFEQGFGLDGERLRRGGEALLTSGGEAGESLLVGSGLHGLRSMLARLDEEARSLVGDGRGRRRLSDAVEGWRRATREIDERAVVPRAWQEAEAARGQAEAELSRLQAQTRALAAESSRLQRARRVAPLLASLDSARATAAELADAPRLEADAEARLAELLAAQRESARDAAREAAEIESLSVLRRALPRDEAVLASQDAVDALSAHRPVAAQAAEDLPAVRARIAGYRARVADALADLGPSLSVDAARDSVPGAGARGRVQHLMSRHSALAATAAAASAGLAVRRRQHDLAAAALSAMPTPPSPALLRRTIERVRAEGPIEAELTRSSHLCRDGEAACSAALAALPLWQGDLSGLLRCTLPLPAQSEALARVVETAAASLVSARAECSAHLAEIAAIEEDIARLTLGEAVPTSAAVTEARQRRDRAWRLLRRQQEGGAFDASERTGLPPGPLPDAYEMLRDEADTLADRRADEAQRVASFLNATARLELFRGRLQRAEQALDAAAADDARARADWHALWEQAGLVAEAPAAMAEWRRAHSEVARLAAEAASASQRHDTLRERCAQARGWLSPLLPSEHPGESLTAMLLRAETLSEALARDEMAHRTRTEALAREEVALAEQNQAVAAAEKALDQWRTEWSPALSALGLDESVAIETIEAVLAAWGRIAEIAPVWRTDEQRAIDMTAALLSFTNEATALCAAIGERAADESASLIAVRLQRRLDQARRADREAAALDARMASHRAVAEEAVRLGRRCDGELCALREAAGVENDADLAQAIARARRRDAAGHEIARLSSALLEQGDGLAEASLRDEASRLDVDEAVARQGEIEQAMAALGEQREWASAARTRAQAVLAEMERGHDAAAKAQDAEDALAEARAVAERYARLRVAQVLLGAGIERFRAEQQGPLLRAASRHFALLTGGRYARLCVDQDANGRAMLLAVRDSGAECPVPALSEGTRDQLYLSLRAASIEEHASHAEPLPFIADDLLVNFDDTRARAAITLLSQLGRTNQTVLFTHHAHIAALAAGQPGVAVLSLG